MNMRIFLIIVINGFYNVISFTIITFNWSCMNHFKCIFIFVMFINKLLNNTIFIQQCSNIFHTKKRITLTKN